jgi:antitoxin (DNA-binding transcriptional repressor) of toxin-antitoxin stability system
MSKPAPNMETHRISVSEFKKHCLQLLQEIFVTGIPLIITKRSVPMVSVTPFAEHKGNQSKKSYFGFLNNTITIKGDIVNFSTQDDWDVNND